MCALWMKRVQTGILHQTVIVVVDQHRSMITAVLVGYTGHTAITMMAIRSSTITTSIPEEGKKKMRKERNQMAKADLCQLGFYCNQIPKTNNKWILPTDTVYQKPNVAYSSIDLQCCPKHQFAPGDMFIHNMNIITHCSLF